MSGLYDKWDERKEDISKFSREQLEDIVFWALHKQTTILHCIADRMDRTDPNVLYIESEANDIWLHYIACKNGEM